ncbi:MAG: anti-sigma factor [Elusimicrobia bacterium]|nr:anti-sigma factor [Elusimicrobiota bacterium]
MGHEKENLSGYLDGVLSDAERGRVEAHLKGCAECRAGLEELRQVSALVRGLPQKPLPAGFLRRLESRRRTPERAEGWASWLAPRSVAWAACAFTVMFVTYKTWNLRTLPAAVSGAASGLNAPPPAPAASRPLELLSTADLVAKAKEQKREEGIAALSGAGGADEGAGVSAAGLAAPAAPRGFGGRAIGEAPAGKPAYSNEALQKHLEAERVRLGIQRIVTPNSVVRALRGVARDLSPAAGQSLDKESLPAPVAGRTTTLLSRPQGPGRSKAEGALVPPDDFSGGAAPVKMRKADVPLPAAVPVETGRVVYSAEESLRLWREQGLPGSAPSVDFSKDMLVVLLGRARIESVAPAADRIVVGFRPLDSAPQPGQRWRVVPRSGLPVVFQPLP